MCLDCLRDCWLIFLRKGQISCLIVHLLYKRIPILFDRSVMNWLRNHLSSKMLSVIIRTLDCLFVYNWGCRGIVFVREEGESWVLCFVRSKLIPFDLILILWLSFEDVFSLRLESVHLGRKWGRLGVGVVVGWGVFVSVLFFVWWGILMSLLLLRALLECDLLYWIQIMAYLLLFYLFTNLSYLEVLLFLWSLESIIFSCIIC